jgi:hypothetical protein
MGTANAAVAKAQLGRKKYNSLCLLLMVLTWQRLLVIQASCGSHKRAQARLVILTGV